MSLTAALAFAVPAAGQLPNLGLPRSDAVPQQSQVILGRALFFDERLSADGTVSCATCHVPDKAFTDGRAVAKGVRHSLGTRNVPTLLNSAFSTSQFWDGRRASLDEQALDPFLNPREHGFADLNELVRRVRQEPEYLKLFAQAFPDDADAISVSNIATAVASFERTLLAGDSPFDRYFYDGQHDALSPSAQRGMMLFRGRAGCANCHLIGERSAEFTDHKFHTLDTGLLPRGEQLAQLSYEAIAARQTSKQLDAQILGRPDIAQLGRFVVTLNVDDLGAFKTPSLRNVALTAPYFHDGSVRTLEAAVELELYYRGIASGRPLILTPTEKKDLIAFLAALTSLNRWWESFPSQDQLTEPFRNGN